MKNKTDVLILIVGGILFGVAMSLRECFDAIWARALTAALAGMVLGFVMFRSRRQNTQKGCASDAKTDHMD
jgi:hypothetical protein